MIGRLPAHWHFAGRSTRRIRTDTEGRFMVEQSSEETTLYAYLPGKGLAGFAMCRSGLDTARVLVSRTGTIRGRVVSSDGKPRAKQRLRVQVARGRRFVAAFRGLGGRDR